MREDMTTKTLNGPPTESGALMPHKQTSVPAVTTNKPHTLCLSLLLLLSPPASFSNKLWRIIQAWLHPSTLFGPANMSNLLKLKYTLASTEHLYLGVQAYGTSLGCLSCALFIAFETNTLLLTCLKHTDLISVYFLL